MARLDRRLEAGVDFLGDCLPIRRFVFPWTDETQKRGEGRDRERRRAVRDDGSGAGARG